MRKLRKLKGNKLDNFYEKFVIIEKFDKFPGHFYSIRFLKISGHSIP